MHQEAVRIRADRGLGSGRATLRTCDLTKEDVAINGDYRS
jgi:glutamate N-acetyltransferase/amino-acid N-acetyltransferase